MKKMKKGLLFVMVLFLVASLCGCRQLDEMRAAHAVYQEDGGIFWNKNAYYILEDVPDSMMPSFSTNTVQITEPDVPVLLSGLFGETADVIEDGTLLTVWTWDGDRIVYCRSDVLDEITVYLQQEVRIDSYYYSYWNDDETYYYLSDEQKETIDRLIATEEPLPEDSEHMMDLEDDEFILSIEGCDEKHLFFNGYVFDIVVKKEGFYLVTEAHSYRVPQSEYDMFAEIVQPYYENVVMEK